MTLKKVSIANLGFALASAPLLQYITSATGQGGKGTVMSALIVGFGGATTGGLAWATGTYALNIYSVPDKNALRIETPTLLGGVTETARLACQQLAGRSAAPALQLHAVRGDCACPTVHPSRSGGLVGRHHPPAGLPSIRDVRGQGRQVLHR